MFLPAIEHDFCLNPTVTRSLSPFITPNVLASPFFISKSTITVISLTPLFLERGQGEVVVGRFRCFFGFFSTCVLLVLNLGQRVRLSFGLQESVSPVVLLSPVNLRPVSIRLFFGTPLQVQMFIIHCKRISLP